MDGCLVILTLKRILEYIFLHCTLSDKTMNLILLLNCSYGVDDDKIGNFT